MESHWADPATERIARFVSDRTGLFFPANRRSVAETGIRRAMTRLGVTDTRAYLQIVQGGGAVLDDLLAELTVGETYFFREPAHFDFLRREIIPRVVARRGDHYAVRAWSAACATGEEAYSLAIAIGDARGGAPRYVLGTDISRDRLARARHGSYRRWSLRGMPAEFVQRHFREERDGFQLHPDVRRAVEYRYLNLAEDRYPAISTGVWGMDVIFCRNVLIYFDRETIHRVAARLIDSLSDDGWLLLGASDPAIGDMVRCEVVQIPGGFAYQRADTKTFGAPASARSLDWPATVQPASDLVPQSEHVHVTREDDSALQSMPARAAPEHEPAPTRSQMDTALEQRDYARVVELARDRVDGGDDSEETAARMVRSLANLGRLDDAGRACAAALERHRGSPELLYLHGILLLQSGHAVEAVAAARRALYLDRGLVVAHLALATGLTRTGDRAGAALSLHNAESLLSLMQPDEIVPSSDGEPAGRLLEMVRVQRALLDRSTT